MRRLSLTSMLLLIEGKANQIFVSLFISILSFAVYREGMRRTNTAATCTSFHPSPVTVQT